MFTLSVDNAVHIASSLSEHYNLLTLPMYEQCAFP